MPDSQSSARGAGDRTALSVLHAWDVLAPSTWQLHPRRPHPPGMWKLCLPRCLGTPCIQGSSIQLNLPSNASWFGRGQMVCVPLAWEELSHVTVEQRQPQALCPCGLHFHGSPWCSCQLPSGSAFACEASGKEVTHLGPGRPVPAQVVLPTPCSLASRKELDGSRIPAVGARHCPTCVSPCPRRLPCFGSSLPTFHVHQQSQEPYETGTPNAVHFLGTRLLR